jgi:hypothetical protein
VGKSVIPKRSVNLGFNLEGYVGRITRLMGLTKSRGKIQFELSYDEADLVMSILAKESASLRILTNDEAGLAEWATHQAKCEVKQCSRCANFDEFKFGGEVYYTSAYASVYRRFFPNGKGTAAEYQFLPDNAVATEHIRKVLDKIMLEVYEPVTQSINADMNVSVREQLSLI